MAPTAKTQHSDALTVAHTKHIFQNVDSEDVSRSTSTYTKTHTRTVTITLAEDTASSTSCSPLVKSSVNPFHHGIASHSLRTLHSPTPLPNANTLAALRVSTPAHRSTYPHPTPPDFLYLHAIIPRATYEIQQPNQDMPGASSNVIWYLPYGFEILIFTVMVLGLVWTGLVVLLNFPPATWTLSRPARRKEKRPLDKPSKRSSIHQRHSATEDKSKHAGPSAQTASISREPGVEHTHRRPQQPAFTCQRSRSSPTTPTRFGNHQSSPGKRSPPNPFLRPPATNPKPLNPPKTPEWLASHAAFFSTHPPASSTPSSYSSRHTSVAVTDTDDYDVEALEAGIAPLAPRVAKKHERKKSWVDLGLGRVEDAVNGFVGRVARWTDNEEGEGMLLPVVDRERGLKVE